MSSLKDSVILVTGGSRGIGAGIAQHLAKQGATLVITGSKASAQLDESLKKLEGTGHYACAMDVTDAAAVDKTIADIIAKFGRIDGLVNNAGITKDQLILRMSADDFDAVISTNLRGAFLCTKAVLKPMLKARKGSIVNITSVIAHMGNPGQCNYAASKAGVEAMTRSLSKEVGRRGIRLNSVAPGFIETDMTHAMTEDQIKRITENIALERMGKVDDVAKVVSFFLSDDSAYVTGQSLIVDGGLHTSS
jgi:3-oxoacyl-[acyl-carrier protein] reductase